MKVFITWSGERSGAFAEVLRQWLPGVIQAVRPYYSPDDIMKGTRWTYEIAQELEGAQIGLLCITPENLKAPWIMYEAGALSKSLDTAKVCPLLFNVEQSQLEGPLVQFQVCEFTKTDYKRVVRMINAQLGEDGLAPNVLDRVFEMWWPQLQADIQKVIDEQPAEEDPEDTRTDTELLQELLQLTRASSRSPRTAGTFNGAAAQDLASSYLSLASEGFGGSLSRLAMQTLVEMASPVRYAVGRSTLDSRTKAEVRTNIEAAKDILERELRVDDSDEQVSEEDFEDVPF